LETLLNREENDFELEVSSPGSERSLILPEQYRKHTGKEVFIVLKDGMSYTGRLSEFDGNRVVIISEKKVKDEKTGKKVLTEVKNEVLMEDIKIAKIIFSKIIYLDNGKP